MGAEGGLVGPEVAHLDVLQGLGHTEDLVTARAGVEQAAIVEPRDDDGDGVRFQDAAEPRRLGQLALTPNEAGQCRR